MRSNSVNFVTIYIREAHAQDEWPVRNKRGLTIRQPQCEQARCDLVGTKLQRRFGYLIPTFSDTMSNQFQQTYGAWPLRAWIIHHGRVIWIFEPRAPGFYDLGDIEQALRALAETQSRNPELSLEIDAHMQSSKSMTHVLV